MRVAVVGCGYWGSKHARVLSADARVQEVVLVDPRQERRDDLIRSFPAARGVATLQQALPEVEAVVVATPPTSHAALALEVLRAGKHVLVEKPLATDLADARALVDTAEDVGVVLMVGHTFEYNAAVWALRDYMSQGVLGDVYYLDSARLNLGLYQSDVNVVWDLGPHDVSIFNHLLGTVPDTVSAWGATHAHSLYEDVAYVRLGYKERDVTAQLHVSWLDPCKVRRVTVVGSQQMVVYNDMATDERLRLYDKGVAQLDRGHSSLEPLHEAPVTYRYGGISSPYIPVPEPLGVQDRHFVECCLTGERPRTDGQNGLAVVEVLTAASLSLREGRPVELIELAE